MRRYGYAAGALLAVLLTALVLLFITVGREAPRVVNLWPLLVALGTSVATWWLQGLIVAVLARPRLGRLRVLGAFRVYMAGTFVAGISPVRGAEIPCEVYLLRRLGLSTGEGSAVVGTRVLLDVTVLTPATLCGLALTSVFREPINPELLLAGATVAGISAAGIMLARGRGRTELDSSGPRLNGSGWLAGGRTKVSGFLGDARGNFASYWGRGHRTTLVYAVALTILYWAFRLSSGPLALMAVGWSGGWTSVIVAQLLLASLILPLAPTPGGSGARELGLAALLSAHVPEAQLSSGIVVYTGLTYCLPLAVGALFAGRQLWREIFLRGKTWKVADQRGPGEAPTPAPARRRTRALL